MADDGMLLNFNLGDTILTSKPDFKGGRWKDRFIAKKAASNRAKRNLDHVNGTQSDQNATGNVDGRPRNDTSDLAVRAKKQRTEGDFRPTAATKGGKEYGGESKAAPKQIISSLFTYNPTSTSQPEPRSRNEIPVEPSNAPLSGELETFTSLGLSPMIATHLLEKMDLKAPTAIQKAAIPQLVDSDSDAFIQAETGSGKTLAYLLPLVNRLMTLFGLDKGSKGELHRDSGLFAIILAPTRELSKQIAAVLETLLRCAYPLVAGTVLGGEKKKSEKARLRKGLNILVATPGRLADHLEHTEALDVSNVRWLVLDEGDRLVELGFEEDIQKIVRKLDMRLKIPKTNAIKSLPGLPSRRTTILCSATMKMDVQRLGEISLKDAVHIKADVIASSKDVDNAVSLDGTNNTSTDTFSAPAQLKQSYAIVPAKLRLVSLVAYLRRAFMRHGSVMKAIVFITCADSVDFHFDVLTRTPWPVDADIDAANTHNHSATTDSSSTTTTTYAPSPILSPLTPHAIITNAHAPPPPPVTVYRLHGTLPQTLRTSTLTHFTRATHPSLLLSTDLSSRGLDLPHLDLVLELDPAFSRAEHLHRIGRTARAGRAGRACVFLLPGPEESYVSLLRLDRPPPLATSSLARTTADEILARGFPPADSAPATATAVQLAVERALLDAAAPPSSADPGRTRLELARRAFTSHVRAYATHVAAERACFEMAGLHLGHLCKAFGLRERPGGLGAGLERRVGGKSGKGGRGGTGAGRGGKGEAVVAVAGRKGARGGEVPEGRAGEAADAAAKMRKKIREQARKGGASEFNLG